ncbi:MAG: hypothetical protein JSS49_21665 [Planctomycetes bacterium]|nr:hypothetical protein [Planctomycetota bacterium]
MQHRHLIAVAGSLSCVCMLSVGTAVAQIGDPVPSFPLPSANETRIERSLGAPTTVQWNEKSLEAAFEELEDHHQIEIWIDKAALADAGMNSDQPISLDTKEISLRSCLKLILEPMGLVPVVEDEVIKITTPEKMGQRTITRIYPVGDLCATPDEAKELMETLECGLGQPHERDGVCHMVISSRLKTLTVRDSYVTQHQVQILLKGLRDAQSTRSPGLTPTPESLPRSNDADSFAPKKI